MCGVGEDNSMGCGLCDFTEIIKRYNMLKEGDEKKPKTENCFFNGSKFEKPSISSQTYMSIFFFSCNLSYAKNLHEV